MKAVTVQSPTRVDLAGGTLDLWPLFNFVGGAVTVNIAIDIFTEARMEPISSGVTLEATDLKLSKSYDDLATALGDTDPSMQLFRGVLKELPFPSQGFSISTRSQSPVGGGLGGSSSLLISLMTAAHRFLGRPLPAPVPLVNWAHNLEAEMLSTPTGTQDYFPAVTGGLNIIRFSSREIIHEALAIDDMPFEKQMLLVYTGRSHHSGLNNFEVLKAAVQKDAVVMGALHDLRSIASEMEETCRNRRWSQLKGLFERELEARLKLTPAFSCPEIESLRDVALRTGAEAIKICGAGGGGCVMVWCPDGQRETIAAACVKAGFQVLNTRPANRRE